MSDASVILAMTACSPFLEYVAQVALRTLRESCEAEVLVLVNNTLEEQREKLRRLCDKIGFRYEYIPGPFSQSIFLNYGIDHTSGEYIVAVNQDSIFYPDWLSHLIELWREQPEYFALFTWSFDVVPMGLGHRSSRVYERRIIPHHQPTSAVVLKRSNGYRWDEQFPIWEMDADFQHFCTKHGHKTGLCLWSRVDHLYGTVCRHIDNPKHMGMPDHCGTASTRLRTKWGLTKPVA